MLSSLLFLASAGQAPQALDRFAEYMRSANTLSVDCKVTMMGAPEASGKLQFERPRRVRFSMSWGLSAYIFSSTERGVVESERATRRYDEFLAQTKLVGPQSRISQTPQIGFPSVLIGGDVRMQLPDGAKISYLGKVKMGGVEVDHVQAIYATQRGQGQSDAFIDAAGRLLKLGQAVNGDEGPLVYAQEYSNYRLNEPLSLESFLNPIPDGFVPHTLPDGPNYLEDGQTFPGLALGRKSGSAAKLEFKGKGTLIAFTAPDCATSARAAKTLAGLRTAATKAGFEFVEVSAATRAADAKAFSGAPDVRFDPSGDGWKAFGVQGTPSLWLVDGKGKFKRYWFGFDPMNAHVLERNVQDALEGKEEED